ncbi:SAG-related sequence [Besnoitia besnoiti]|uniref:SAG-related sequence n=1 Tax=Besnoitia besnoiti TaxID=94643 RepID=A0A2A9MFN4_BESBE|nr:SAG-related sequence [Besnoitia besnoiti]PFH36805.1 SAG-related sequence [Besnoitia besnoiti]
MASIWNMQCARRRRIHIEAQVQRTPFSSCLLYWTALLFFVSAAALPKGTPLSVLEARATESNCAPPAQSVRTKCACDANAAALDLEATISEGTNELEIHCKANLSYSPEGLEGSKVCSANFADLAQCKLKSDKSGCIDVNTLLLSTSPPVNWQPSTNVPGGDQPKVLSVPKEKLPYIDGQFIVGCSDSKGSTTKCKVAVTVAARATETKDQQVTCSYGKDSNKKHQTITLSPSQNSFTLVCGEKGEIVQTNYKKTYCDVSEENAAVKDCHGKYKDILPGYEEAWWTDGEEKSFTFTIPEDKFPMAGAKMMVQCQKAEEKQVKDPTAPAPQPSVCSVDVIIESAGVPSSASVPFVSGLCNMIVLACSELIWRSSHLIGL